MSVPFFPHCPSQSESSVACAGRADIVKFSPVEARLQEDFDDANSQAYQAIQDIQVRLTR